MAVALSGKSGTVRAGQPEQGTRFTVRRIDAGRLRLPTGRVCIADAYSSDQYPPLNRIVPDGEYAVELVIAEVPKNLPFGNDRCAFVVVTFSKDAVASWQPVTAVKSADPNFTDGKPNGFVQEGATGLFSPEAGAVHFAHLRQQFNEQLTTIRAKADQFGTNEWINYRPGDDAGNVIIVEGGMGDGEFECFVGVTEINRVARLVVDFGIADPTGS
jgi:hypothetical protein